MTNQTDTTSQASGQLATAQRGGSTVDLNAGFSGVQVRVKTVKTDLGIKFEAEITSGYRAGNLVCHAQTDIPIRWPRADSAEIWLAETGFTVIPDQRNVQEYAYGDWMHHFGAGSKETRCRVVIDLEQNTLIAAQEWTGLNFEDVLSQRFQDLAESVIGAHGAHDNPEDWGLGVSDALPEWAEHLVQKDNLRLAAIMLEHIQQLKKLEDQVDALLSGPAKQLIGRIAAVSAAFLPDLEIEASNFPNDGFYKSEIRTALIKREMELRSSSSENQTPKSK